MEDTTAQGGGYTIIELPESAWRRYKRLRLEALHYDPSAFADSYREGRGKPPEVWKKRLRDAVQGTATKLFFAQRGPDLVGMVGLEFDIRDKRLHTAKIREMFVSPTSRGGGVGKKLIETALQFVEKKRKRIKKIALAVNVTQPAAIKLYQKFGFVIIGIAKKEIKVHGYFIDQCLMEKYL